MITSIVICAVTCVLMILSILLLPQIKIGKLKLDTYCVVALAGAYCEYHKSLQATNEVFLRYFQQK